MGERWQHPCPRGGCFRIPLDHGVDHKGPVRLDGMTENVFEVARLGHLRPVRSARLCQSGEIGVVELSRLFPLEACHDLPAGPRTVGLMPDDIPTKVVPDDPNDGDVVLDRGAEDVGRHHEPAIAADGNACLPRCREFCTQGPAHPKPHGGKTPGLKHAPGLVDVVKLEKPVMMFSHI